MKKLGYILFLAFFLNACSDSSIKERLVELEGENKLIENSIDSLMQLEPIRFNEILEKETGTAKDTILIKDYKEFIEAAKSDYWINLSNNQISTLKIRSAKQVVEKKLFGIWSWTLSDGGWGEDLRTPETEKRTQKIVINEDYSIQYYENGKEVKKDSFYLTTERFLPKYYFTFINLIEQKRAQGFEIVGVGDNERLIFYEPWCQDCPSEEFKRIKK